jgi:hypothetical protein
MNISTGLIRKMDDFDPKIKDILLCFMEEIEEKITAIIERDRDWYVSLCTELDIDSQGDTVTEARDDLREAL